MKRPAWLRSLRARTIRTRPTNWAERPPEDAWQAAIDGEVKFWATYLATKGERYPGSYETRIDPELALQPEIAALIDVPDGETVRLLDVGAGPLTFLGRTSPRWPIEVTAVDALGPQYSQLLDDAGVEPPVRTQTCESEKLSELLAPDTFDIVAARNTLDHSYDPVLAISEMLTCAKPGAALFLKHHRNTAEDEHYHGMHQWNFEAGDNTLVVWRPGQRTDVGGTLGDRGFIEQTSTEGAWEYVVIRKASREEPSTS